MDIILNNQSTPDDASPVDNRDHDRDHEADADTIDMTLTCLLSRTVLEKIKAPSPEATIPDTITYRTRLLATFSQLMMGTDDATVEKEFIPQHIRTTFMDFVTACALHYRQMDRYGPLNDPITIDDTPPMAHIPTLDHFLPLLRNPHLTTTEKKNDLNII